MDRSKADRARDQVIQRLQKLIDKLDIAENDDKFIKCFSEDSCKYELDISNLALAPSGLSASLQILTGLAWETEKLVREAQEEHYHSLLLYGIPNISNVEDEPPLKGISKLLPSLIKTSNFLSQVSHVFRNLLLQLREFHSMKIIPNCPNECSLIPIWRCLGDLLAVFMSIDEIIRNRPILKQHWQQYFKSMCSTEYNPAMLGVTAEQLRPLIVQLTQIDAQILSGNCLRNCYEQSYGDLDDDLSFANHLKNTVLSLFDKWYRFAGATESINKRELISCTLLSVFYHLHFAKPDKKMIKTIWTSHKKIVSFNLIGDITFIPGLFLLHEIPEISGLVDKKSIGIVQTAREKMSLPALLQEAIGVEQLANEWAINLNSLPQTPSASSALTSVDVFLKGIQHSDTLTRLIKSALSLLLEDRISKTHSTQIFSLIQTVKNLSLSFSTHWEFLSECVSMASQQWRCHSINLLEKLRTPMAKEQNSWTMINAAMRILLQTATPPRVTAVYVSLGLAQFEKHMEKDDVLELNTLLNRIRSVTNIRNLTQRVTDCSFLLYHLPVISLYWRTSAEFCYSHESIQAINSALTDCCQLLKRANVNTDQFLNWVYETIKQFLLSPLHSIVENDLRILTHKHLKVDERDKASSEVEAFCQRLTKMRYLRIDDMIIDIKEFLERCLQKNFYNMSCVALSDRESYCKMADLALHKFGLDLVDGHLPQHSFHEGFSPVDVMRNIKQFTSRFNYCHSMQLFFEHRNTSDKSLLVLSHENVSIALHIHGIGLLHTTLNVVYQFLRSKFLVLQQFMMDEHIHAQLQRDARYFEENKDSIKLQYPYKRAEKFNKAIAKLSDGEEASFMDKLRQVITEIGNALGYARAMACAAAAQKSSHRRYEEQDEFGWVDQEAIHADILGLIRNEQTTSARHFLSLFVNVFRTAIREQSGEQLKLFYVLAPPLTINFAEHMLSCRDRLDKRIGSSAFVDDGFAVGIAFLISVLEAASEFTSLNWFKSLEMKFNTELSVLGEDLDGIAKLRRSRLEASIKEYRQLSLCLSSSLLLFTEEETGLV